MTRRARALAVVLGLAAVLAAAPAAPAQRKPAPQAEQSPFWEETQAFRRILYDAGGRSRLKPLREMSWQTEPNKTLVVVLGDPSLLNWLDERVGGRGLREFVERGGALLIATDFPTPPELERAFGVRVSGDKVALPDGSPDAWHGQGKLPFVLPAPGQTPPLFEPRLPGARGAAPPRVASNWTSYLRVPRRTWLNRLATLPADVRDEAGRRPASLDFAYGLDYGGESGRVLIMADHSVFINAMMLQLPTDNGNLDFGLRCADWLMTRPGGERKPRDQILFYEDGVVRTDFNIPLKDLPPPPLPPPDTLMGWLDEGLHAMEEEGTFAQMEEDDLANDTIEDVMAAVPLWEGVAPNWKLWTLAVIAASVGLGLYAAVRLGAFRHRPEATSPVLAELLARQAPAGAVMAQRQEELLREGNLWEAARALARQLFAAAGASPDAAPLPPAIEVRGRWWGRWRARLRWRQLWRLARSARPVRVSPRGFTRLADRVRALRAALTDGTVRIVP